MAEADPGPPQTAEENSAAPAAETPATPSARPKRGKRMILLLVIPLLIAAGVGVFWYLTLGKITTDNAYIKQDTVAVAAEITGPISEVLVRDGQMVKAGDVLFRIDAEPFELALSEAQADLATAQANVTALSNDAALSGADIEAARKDIAFAQSRFERQKALWDKGFTTKADYDAAKHEVEQARAALDLAQADRREAQAQLAQGAAVPGVNPRVASAMARIAEARLNLKRSEVRAPISGQVTQADRIQVGQQAIASVPMLQVVAQSGAYVEANFKETDLDEMEPGQRVKIEIDAYPGLELEGHVESIGAGTGSEFSILPAQNASGNWVKVTQRVPVRIAIDSESPRKLIAGLSADVTVITKED